MGIWAQRNTFESKIASILDKIASILDNIMIFPHKKTPSHMATDIINSFIHQPQGNLVAICRLPDAGPK